VRDTFVREIELVGRLDEEQRSRILDISKRCPVHLTMERGSDIETVLVPAGAIDEEAVTRCEHLRDMDEACA
jgi:putative redox protein